MPDALYEVTCKACGRTLVRTHRIRCGEVAIIREHVKGCFACDRLTEDAPLGQLFRQIGVSILKV